MGYTDLHTHTTFCDGRNTPEEMVISAIDKGITTLGLLAHSYVKFDEHYAIAPGRVEEFRAEVLRLRDKYKEKIRILFGIEADYYATEIYGGTDYIIGSCHYFRFGDEYRSVDMSRDELVRIIDEKFGGDPYAMTEAYYDTVSRVGEELHADIVGHFDLVMKFNEDLTVFDPSGERYRRAWMRAADKLISDGVVFEINTGAMARGRRTVPYPAAEIIDYIRRRGGKLLLSSDAHFAEKLAFSFEDYKDLVNFEI